MAHVDYFFALGSPFTYLAGLRLEEIVARHGASLAYRPLDIAQLFARTGGLPVGQRHPNRQAYRLQDLRRQSRKTGLPILLDLPVRAVNGAPGAYAIIAAQKAGGGDLGALVHSFPRAVWAEGRDIADDAVIRELLTAAGFDPGLADKGLFTSVDAYEANLEEAVNRGVFGAPFYIVRETDERFWGQDRLADLDAHLGGQL
jgi:2-hydroxychromene-2-carboxylate isomerase